MIISVLIENCDTCDSKKDETPCYACVRARVKEEIIDILHFITKWLRCAVYEVCIELQKSILGNRRVVLKK